MNIVSTMERNAPASPFADLIDDVLFRVFKYLRRNDRKIARLVCRRWDEILTQWAFTKDQVIRICNERNARIVATALQGCRHTNLAVKLTRPRTWKNEGDWTYFWETLGPKIGSVYLEETRLPGQFELKIFIYCVNLREFSSHARTSNQTTRDFLAPRKDLQPARENLVRDSLRVLCLKSTDSLLCYKLKDLLIIAQVFPNLEILKIKFMPKALLESEVQLQQTEIDELAHKLRSIKAIYINVEFSHPSECYESRNHPVIKEFLKMTNIRLRNKIEFFREGSVGWITEHKMDFSHPYWNHLVSLQFNAFYELIDVPDIAHLLQKLPSLKSVRLATESCIADTPIVKILFPALVKSQLESIYLECVSHGDYDHNCNRGEWQTIPWPDTCVNLTVHRLVLDLGIIDDDPDKHNYSPKLLTSLFMRYFLGLRRLNIESCLTTYDPNAIFRYQAGDSLMEIFAQTPQIRRMFLIFEGTHSSHSRNLEDVSVNNILKIQRGIADPFLHLKRLSTKCGSEWLYLFSTCNFSNLVYLKISYRWSCDGWLSEFSELITAIARTCSNLETFKIERLLVLDIEILKLPSILLLCQRCTWLHFLSLRMYCGENCKKLMPRDQTVKEEMVTFIQQSSCCNKVNVQLIIDGNNYFAFFNYITKEVEFSIIYKDTWDFMDID